MLTTSDFKKGVRVELDGAPWTIVSVTTQTPSARGAATLVKAHFKNILSGQVSDRTFKAGENCLQTWRCVKHNICTQVQTKEKPYTSGYE